MYEKSGPLWCLRLRFLPTCAPTAIHSVLWAEAGPGGRQASTAGHKGVAALPWKARAPDKVGKFQRG